MRASLVVQWLRLCTSTVGEVGLIPGWGSSVCCEVQPKRKKKKTRELGQWLWKGAEGRRASLSKFEGAHNEPVRKVQKLWTTLRFSSLKKVMSNNGKEL